MDTQLNKPDLLTLTSDIVASYASCNTLGIEEMPLLIEHVFTALSTMSKESPSPHRLRPEPAVPIKKSITPDYIICLEDGKKLKILKRHLKTAYNMSVKEYKARWNLADDYPMVAPNYTKKRSDLAKSAGLGTRAKPKKRWL